MGSDNFFNKAITAMLFFETGLFKKDRGYDADDGVYNNNTTYNGFRYRPPIRFANGRTKTGVTYTKFDRQLARMRKEREDHNK